MAIKKSRSENKNMHNLLTEMKLKLIEFGADIQIQWVSTSVMAGQFLADQPSRGIYTLNNLGLSKAGADKFRSIFQNFSKSVGEKSAVSLFASPANNPFNIPYCSIVIDFADKNCLRTCAFKALKYGLDKNFDSVFAFPSPTHTIWFINLLCNSNWAKNKTFYLLIHSEFLAMSLIELSRVASITSKHFAGKINRNLFHGCPHSKYRALKVIFDKKF